MKKSFWIPAIVLYVVNVIFCDSVQVGTVLFTTTDLVRKCWSECDKSLLKARFLMQDILPDPDCIDFSNPEAVAILLDYFHACFQIISTSTYGKLQNLMYLALSDALGGYMRAYVLPFTRRAYYSGQVKYSEAKKLFQLYEEIKTFLKTNGAGWTEPQKPNFRKIHVNPLAITGGALQACKLLFIIEKRGKARHGSHNPNTEHIGSYNTELAKKTKESSTGIPYESINSTYCPNRRWNSTTDNEAGDETKSLHSLNEKTSPNGEKFLKNFFKVIAMNTSGLLQEDAGTSEMSKSRHYRGCSKSSEDSCSYKKVLVPLPILDDSSTPYSIALPFKRQPLRNLKSRSSAFILEHYYNAVVKCFIAKGISRADIKNFNSRFYSWLVSQVYPHLSEEEWYPAFGGVLRIMETIRRFGADNSAHDLSERDLPPRDLPSRDIGYLFDSGVEFEIEGSKRREKTRNVDIFEEDCAYSKRHVVTAVLLVSVIWIFVFFACIFYFQAGRCRNIFYEDSSETEFFHSRGQKKKEGSVNFQFLVRFFKKRNQSTSTVHEHAVYYSVPKTRPNVPRREKQLEPKLWPSDNQLRKNKQPENERLISYGHGDFPALDIPAMKKHFKSSISTWPGQPCLVLPEKLEHVKTEKISGDELNPPKEKRHRIEMLWKKPSLKLKRNIIREGRERKSPKKRRDLIASRTTMSENIFKKNSSNTYSASAEDDTKSTEKASSSCCCSSESCQHSNSTTSNTSSNSQVQHHLHKSKPLSPLPLNLLSFFQIEEKLRSDSTEFVGEIMSQHRPFKKVQRENQETVRRRGRKVFFK